MTNRQNLPTLSEYLNMTLYSLREALDLQGWTYELPDDGDESYAVRGVRCCDYVEIPSPWITDYAYCPVCSKAIYHMEWLLGILRFGVRDLMPPHMETRPYRRDDIVWNISSGEEQVKAWNFKKGGE